MTDMKVGQHKAVYIAYSIVDGQGQVFEQIDTPIGYVHGADSGVFEKVEAALEGCIIGDRREVTLNPEEGFGDHRPELTFTDDIDNVPPEYRYVGAEVEFSNDQGETLMFRVTQVGDGKLTIDGNHPLAGQTVTFVVTVAGIREAAPEEIATGRTVDEGMPSLH